MFDLIILIDLLERKDRIYKVQYLPELLVLTISDVVVEEGDAITPWVPVVSLD